MIIEVPYNYLILAALMLLKKYENKDGIEINILEDFIDNMLEEVITIYEENTDIKYSYDATADKWQGEIKFNLNGNYLANFLDKYGASFKATDNLLMAKGNISYDDLLNMLDQEKTNEKLGLRFETPLEFRSTLDTLKIKSIESFLQRYLKDEQKLEQAFINQDKKAIFKYYLMRHNFINWLEQMPAYIVDAFRNIIFIMKMENEEAQLNNYHPPVDKERWEASPYYKPFDSLLDIEDRIYDDFQFAIFGTSSIAEEKVYDMIEDIYLVKIAKEYTSSWAFDDEDELAEDAEEEWGSIEFEEMAGDEDYEADEEAKLTYYADDRKLFYLIFLKRLNSYINNYGAKPILLHAKNRLLYALDMPEHCLANESNLETAIAEIKDKTDIQDYGEFLTGEMRFMADDIFNYGLVEEQTFLKLIFMGTYYEITNDLQFRKIVESHANSKLYALFQPIIFNKAENYVLKRKKK